MRALPLGLVLLLAPLAAAEEDETFYLVTGGGCGGGSPLIQNCETYFPASGTSVSVAVDDLRADSVFVRVCHEWTYDDGSHPRVSCAGACDALVDPLRFPPGPGVTYRVIVDLRHGPGECSAKPLAGALRVGFV